MATNMQPINDAITKIKAGMTDLGSALGSAFGSVDAAVAKAVSDANAAIAALDARLDALEAGEPPDVEEPPPDIEEPPPDGGGGGSEFVFDPKTTTRAYMEANTGVKPGSVLQDHNGQNIGNGAVLENKKFRGTLRIQANDVTLRNCLVEGGDWNGIDAEGSNRLRLENVTVIGATTMNYNNAILSGSNATILRCNISKHQHGCTPQGGPETVVRHNFIHDPYMVADKHVGGISIKGGSNFTAMLVEENWVEGLDTSCVFIKNDFGPVKNTTVRRNRLINVPGKQTAYTCYSTSDGPGGTNQVSGTKFLDNVLEEGHWGYWSVYPSSQQVVMTGNTNTQGQNIDNAVKASDEGGKPGKK